MSTRGGELHLDREAWAAACEAHLIEWVLANVVGDAGPGPAAAFAAWYRGEYPVTAGTVRGLPRYPGAYAEWRGGAWLGSQRPYAAGAGAAR